MVISKPPLLIFWNIEFSFDLFFLFLSSSTLVSFCREKSWYKVLSLLRRWAARLGGGVLFKDLRFLLRYFGNRSDLTVGINTDISPWFYLWENRKVCAFQSRFLVADPILELSIFLRSLSFSYYNLYNYAFESYTGIDNFLKFGFYEISSFSFVMSSNWMLELACNHMSVMFFCSSFYYGSYWTSMSLRIKVLSFLSPWLFSGDLEATTPPSPIDCRLYLPTGTSMNAPFFTSSLSSLFFDLELSTLKFWLEA